MCYDESRLKTPSFNKYLIPTAMDVPLYQSFVMESRSDLGAFDAPTVREGVVGARRATEGAG